MNAGDTLVYQSGVVPEGTPVTDLQDPDLWLLRDCMFDTKGSPVNMFWQAAQYDTNQLPAQLTFDKLDPRYYQTHVYKTYPGGSLSLPMAVDKVRLRMRLETVGLDVIRDLTSQGDLDSAVSPPVVQVGKELVWTRATATEAFKVQGVIPATCITATNLSGAAFSVPAKLNCQAPAPADAGLAADGASSTDGTEQVSCSGDARVDVYSANLTKISPGGLQVAISQATPAPPAKGLNSWTMMISDQRWKPHRRGRHHGHPLYARSWAWHQREGGGHARGGRPLLFHAAVSVHARGLAGNCDHTGRRDERIGELLLLYRRLMLRSPLHVRNQPERTLAKSSAGTVTDCPGAGGTKGHSRGPSTRRRESARCAMARESAPRFRAGVHRWYCS